MWYFEGHVGEEAADETGAADAAAAAAVHNPRGVEDRGVGGGGAGGGWNGGAASANDPVSLASLANFVPEIASKKQSASAEGSSSYTEWAKDKQRGQSQQGLGLDGGTDGVKSVQVGEEVEAEARTAAVATPTPAPLPPVPKKAPAAVPVPADGDESSDEEL